MVTVLRTVPRSPADKAGIIAGDIIISVNGSEINDVLDYDFHTAEKNLEVLVHRGPELFTFKIKKQEYDPLGCEFETFLMDKKQVCRNRCVFCFIDQNPKGMRKSIYFKDDDSRMSFLSGNYITLTNLSRHDADRIIKMHISPINISVHTTDPALRVAMMRNERAGECLSYMDEFARAGIKMNAQIVLCPGINDGDALRRTLADLEKYVPSLQSIAVVPVGITKHRCGLYPLRCVTKEEAAETVKTLEEFGKRALEKYGSRIAYPSDEFYLSAGLPVPDESFYEDFPQLDNGVGMIRSLLCEVDERLLREEASEGVPEPFSVATGYAAYGCLSLAKEKVCGALYGGRDDFVNIYRIKNDFFGDTVTVAGLVTGSDLTAQLKGKALGKVLYIPKVMLRYEQDRFLDDVTVEEAEAALGVKIEPVEVGGEAFVDMFRAAERHENGGE